MKTGTLKSVLLLGTAVLVLMSGCGGVYMNLKTPMPTLDMQVNADGQAKVGKASAEMFVWLVVVGDCSLSTAMTNGGITRIHHVDTEVQSVLFGVYGKFTTVVYGE